MKTGFCLLAVLLYLPVASWGQTCNSAIQSSTPDARFRVMGDEVLDLETGLIWQHCTMGRSGSDCGQGSAQEYDWQQALQAAEALRVSSGLPWRLPNLQELDSITDEKCALPSINTRIFPNTDAAYFWSSTPEPAGTADVWAIHFYFGDAQNLDKSTWGVQLRLLRDRQ